MYVCVFSSHQLRIAHYLFAIGTSVRPPLWSEFMATDPEVPGSVPGATKFSEK
jgi:hypothetical protein